MVSKRVHDVVLTVRHLFSSSHLHVFDDMMTKAI